MARGGGNEKPWQGEGQREELSFSEAVGKVGRTSSTPSGKKKTSFRIQRGKDSSVPVQR